MMNGTANYGDSEAKRKYWKRVYSKVAITNLPFLAIPIFLKVPKICGFIYMYIYFLEGGLFIHYHSNIVGSKPLLHSCGQNSNAASAIRVVWAQPNSTSTLDSMPALAALNKSTHCECEIRPRLGISVTFCNYVDLKFSKN